MDLQYPTMTKDERNIQLWLSIVGPCYKKPHLCADQKKRNHICVSFTIN